jgi:hypothetical protein
MRKKGENSVNFAGKSWDSTRREIMISRFGVESQTARYIGRVAMTCTDRSFTEFAVKKSVL